MRSNNSSNTSIEQRLSDGQLFERPGFDSHTRTQMCARCPSLSWTGIGRACPTDKCRRCNMANPSAWHVAHSPMDCLERQGLYMNQHIFLKMNSHFYKLTAHEVQTKIFLDLVLKTCTQTTFACRCEFLTQLEACVL